MSYRRDDTAGRAGRLNDALVSRLGARNVFMDVAAIEVGTDFVGQVGRAIADSDVSLVVIGPDWLRLEDADGHRRLDDPDDHVRSEVRAALDSPNAVVPVLVAGATLPSEADLPPDLAPLVRRQAVELHDETWLQDVEMLIRRLEGKAVVRSRRPLLPIAAILVVVGVGVAVAFWPETDPSSDGALPICQMPDGSFTTIALPPDNPEDVVPADEHIVRFTVLNVAFKKQGDKWNVLLETAMDNETTDQNVPPPTYSSSWLTALVVDRIPQLEPDCFRKGVGDHDSVAPKQRAVAWVGFESDIDPDGAALTLETEDGGSIVITPDS